MPTKAESDAISHADGFGFKLIKTIHDDGVVRREELSFVGFIDMGVVYEPEFVSDALTKLINASILVQTTNEEYSLSDSGRELYRQLGAYLEG